MYQQPQPPRYNVATPPPTQLRPAWARRLETLHSARIARQFVLHFNINDFVVDLTTVTQQGQDGHPIQRVAPQVPPQWQNGEAPTFRLYLHDFLFNAFRCQSIYTYSIAAGLLADDRTHRGLGQPLSRELDESTYGPVEKTLRKFGLGGQNPQNPQGAQSTQAGQSGQRAEGQEVRFPRAVPDNLKILGHVLRRTYLDKNDQYASNAQEPIAVILDYAEKLVPYQTGEGQGTPEQLQALETVQSWAIDPVIRDTDNIIILLTTNIGALPPSLFGEGSGCRDIRVALPNEPEREAYIRHKSQIPSLRYRMAALATGFAAQTDQSQEARIHGFARATQGMRLSDIDALNRETVMHWMQESERFDVQAALGPHGAVIKPEHVRGAKAESIQRQSSQLLEIVPPERGFDEIGGMVELKKYLRVRTEMMAAGLQSPLIPSGLLLAGPPGTGKTIIAEALATEGKFNLVKMRNIQDRWVGSSERNLDMVLSLLQDLHPVIVFVDEIDQAMGRRDTGQNGDSGVSARMFARILEEMSKASNRGRIMWVAATNRTDILDDALLRRFDRVVPLLAPDADESRRIFAAMPSMISKQTGGEINVTYGGDLVQGGHEDENGRPSPTVQDLAKFQRVAEVAAGIGLTGAEIEIVVRRAVEYAEEDRIDELKKRNQTGSHQAINLAALPAAQFADLPPIASQHLIKAMDDFKVNHNPLVYDFQSLMAIRSCNFYSILPKRLPNRPVFQRIMKNNRIDPQLLEATIRDVGTQINSPYGAGAP